MPGNLPQKTRNCAQFLLICVSLVIIAVSCASPQAQLQHTEFYMGLIEHDTSRKIKFFEMALLSPNEYVRSAAAEELAVLMSRGNTLSSGTVKTVQKEVKGFWADAFSAAHDIKKENVLSFLFKYDLNTASFHGARNFVLGACEKLHITFSKSEKAVIDGFFAVSCGSFNEALRFFRDFQIDIHSDDETLTEKKWPDQLPEIFIQYPILINNLGRSFQNTETGSEGITLFQKWEAELAAKDNSLKDHHYRLLYCAGRIARARGLRSALPFFERALAFVEEGDQTDICIWNILDRSLNESTEKLLENLEKFIPLWYKGSFYNDIMVRYLQNLAAVQDWNKIIRTFNLIKNTNADVQKAAFAWIIERAIEENLLSASEMRLAAQAVSSYGLETTPQGSAAGSPPDPLAFARIAYNASASFTIPSLYYRSKTSAVLGLPFIEYAENTAENTGTTQAVQFLLDFFKYGMSNLANPYIRAMENDLSPDELRALARAYAKEEMYNLSMRLIQVYIHRESYSKEKQDLELMFPRPYLELIEKYTGQYNLEPSMMLGLIRAESAFQPSIVSRAGAVGLAQFMPATAADVADRIRRAGGPNYASDEYNLDRTIPELSIHMGCYYLNMRRNQLNDIQLALMAYNGGVPRIQRAQRANPKLPPDLIVETHPIYETRDYGRRVPGFAAVYKALYY